ncbi:MAG TPA: RICIN domain-containing protein [Trebonia sp.]|nr:RICIN domain-containing protein [Trebonia sp.]
MLTRLGPLHWPLPRRASAVGAGLVLAAGLGAAAAPIASAAPAASPSPAVVIPYQLQNYGSYGLCLDTASGSNESIVNTCGYLADVPPTQAWSFEHISPSPYIQVEDLNGDCIGVEAASKAQGAEVVLTSCALTTNREWDPVYVKTVDGTYMYEFVNRNSALCLTDDNDSDAPGHEVNQSTCTGNDAMLWYVAGNGGSL